MRWRDAMASIKGQASLEYLVLVGIFAMTILPLAFLFFSQSSIRSEPLKQEQFNTAVQLLKQAAESSFAQCPSNKSVLLSLPSTAKNITIEKDVGELPYLKVVGEKNSFVMPLDIEDKSNKVVVNGAVVGTGQIRASVSCSYDTAGMPTITIGNEEVI
ncbi:MAG: hypothetical protein D6769_01835 [Methanobacteriota archaeon]|nr:MAG: hypothetical protein D6769_01835 [Euryarchaeota archaeon]